ncbi:hypothetical protein Adi01nite_80300 [Amorphoplanes digitatis]|nr:hypothetical protein GCM10020092_088460 [Actinoplanes digitatis]GID98618.1 hypothetical protein Adi01nite_80300 [Actinoplanes digitatis]
MYRYLPIALATGRILMKSVVPAFVAGIAALLGVLIGSWRQAGLQRSLARAELIRSWQDERRTSYLNLLVADDEYPGAWPDSNGAAILGFSDARLPGIPRVGQA